MAQDTRKKLEPSVSPEPEKAAGGGAAASGVQPPAPPPSAASPGGPPPGTQPQKPAPPGKTAPGPVPRAVPQAPAAAAPPSLPRGTAAAGGYDETGAPGRRVARRRPSGPSRGPIPAANDDGPAIASLIHALEQKPSNAPFHYAYAASAAWLLVSGGLTWAALSQEIAKGNGLWQLLTSPPGFFAAAAVAVPVAVMWFLAMLAWRAEELRLRSSAMTEVAVRLAEPDRMAEQAVASLGQAVRRQVSFMNDAVSRALGRASELEALVHSEVAALDQSYEVNESKIRALIEKLAGERSALLETSQRVTESLRTLGNEVPALIDKLGHQQVKLSDLIQGAGQNLASLENAITDSVSRLETTLGNRTEHLQAVLTEYTEALGGALEARTGQMQAMLTDQTEGLVTALGSRTDHLQVVFEEYVRALDSTLANRSQALDMQLVERTRSLDAAFSERLRLFDESIMRSTMAIDRAVGEKAHALTTALDTHAKAFCEAVGRQAVELDEALMHGINAVRRSSENITRQSLKAIEGLAGQSDLLKNVSENLLSQINAVTGKFDAQGQSLLSAANTLETANAKIGSVLQSRHAELLSTLDQLSHRAEDFSQVMASYSNAIERQLTQAEYRARHVAEEFKTGTESYQRAMLSDLERLKAQADAESSRALEDLHGRFTAVSNELTRQIGNLGSRFDETSEEVRQRAARTAAELAEQEARLREHMERLPAASRENTEAMRRALQDQIRALEQLAQINARAAASRDVMPPLPGGTLTTAYANETRAREEAVQEPQRALSSLTQRAGYRPATAAGNTGGTGNPGTVHGGAAPQQQAAAPAAAAASAEARAEGWSMGDLLARASFDDDGHAPSRQQPQRPAPALGTSLPLDTAALARALDPATATAIWARLRAGQRNVMVRSIYSSEGQMTFDEISRLYKSDAMMQAAVQRYVTDFERLISEADLQDPSGRLAQSHFVSESGRVYLFLAHASGRIT